MAGTVVVVRSWSMEQYIGHITLRPEVVEVSEVVDNNFPDIEGHSYGCMIQRLEGVEQMGYLVVEGRDRDHLGHIAPALEILDQMN